MLWRAGVRGGALTVDLRLEGSAAPRGARSRRRGAARTAVLALEPARRARARVRRVRRRVRAHPAVGARRRRDAQGDRVRASPRSADRRRVLPRPRARAHRQGARAALSRRCSRRPRSSRRSGSIDVYAVPLSWWRLSAGWYQHQLGLDYGPACPTCRRTSSTTRATTSSSGGSPRRSSRRSRPPTCSSSRCSSSRCDGAGGFRSRVLLFAAILWTHTRAAVIALAAGLIVLALVRRRVQFLGLGGGGRARGVRVRQGLRPLRARGRTSPPPSRVVQERNGSQSPERVARSDRGGRVVDERAPGEPARRREDGAEASVGLRARQLRRDGGADARRDQGGGVDLHGARCRDRAARRARLHCLVACAACAGRCAAIRGSEPRSPRCSCSGCRRT